MSGIVRLSAWALAMAGGLGAAPLAAQEKITIATEGAYAPYNFKDAAGNLVGFEVDLAAELCARMEVECELVEQAWDGMIPALTAKKYDVIMAGMSITDERKKVIAFSRAYSQTPITFITLEGSDLAALSSDVKEITLGALDEAEQAAIDGLGEGLSGRIVGVQAATTHEKFVATFMPEVELKTYDNMDNMILDLEAGRIDAGYTDMTYLQSARANNPEITTFGPPMNGGVLGEGVGAGIRQEDGELVEKFSTAIGSMIEDGSLAALSVEWFGFDASAKD